MRAVADGLAALPPAEAAVELAEVERLVRERLLPHEREDDARVYPAVERALGGDDPIAAMHRTHREVHRLGGLLTRMTIDLPPEGLGPAAANDFRRVLYGLDAILRLHFAQEDELYHGLADAEHVALQAAAAGAGAGRDDAGRP
ncbi:hemerythrin domain-containing protein [Dankookia sp. P2]|uniref:hemerythrin domain-containing protein n=1 Tax=Dankookia sp. P2 TaxID=3423955 RepID=UPI003D66CE51